MTMNFATVNDDRLKGIMDDLTATIVDQERHRIFRALLAEDSIDEDTFAIIEAIVNPRLRLK